MFNTGHMRSTGFPPLSDGRAGGSLTAAGSGWWLDEGKTVGSVARDLDLTEAALREWVTRARTDSTGGKTGLKTTEAKSSAVVPSASQAIRYRLAKSVTVSGVAVAPVDEHELALVPLSTLDVGDQLFD